MRVALVTLASANWKAPGANRFHNGTNRKTRKQEFVLDFLPAFQSS